MSVGFAFWHSRFPVVSECRLILPNFAEVSDLQGSLWFYADRKGDPWRFPTRSAWAAILCFGVFVCLHSFSCFGCFGCFSCFG